MRRTYAYKIAIALLIFLGGVTNAYAESFKLTPKNPKGNDDQLIKFHYSANPGDVIEDSMHVTRKYLYSQKPAVDVNYYVVDGHMTQDGFISMESEFDTSDLIGKWTKLGKTTETIKYETDVPFTITIPKNATPGQYIGGFVLTEVEDEEAKTVNQQSNLTKVRLRYATTIRVDVNGEINTGFEVSNINYQIKDGSLNLKFDFINKGNVIHEFSGFYTLDGVFKDKKIEIPLKKVLPGETVNFEYKYDRILDLLGGFDINLELESRVDFEDRRRTQKFDDIKHVNYIPTTLSLALLFTFLAIYVIIFRLIKKRVKHIDDSKNIKNKMRSKD